jgi:3-oxoacyl-[acyl-carrier protein] reductase
MLDNGFKRIVSLFGVKPAKLMRRVPLNGKTLTPVVHSHNILENMTVVSLKLNPSDLSDSIITAAITDAGGKLVFDSDSVSKIDGIVVDVRHTERIDQLKQLHTTLGPLLPKLSKNGRLVIIGGDVSDNMNVVSTTVANGVSGFTRAIAKEIARSGITANMVSVPTRSNIKIPGVVQFILSRRSAFITGQTIKLSHTPVATAADMDVGKAFSISGKTVLLTGAAGGIGEYTARLFHSEGANLLLLDHPGAEKQLAALAEELSCAHIALDITKEDSLEFLRDKLIRSFPSAKLDVVIHNAGITRDKTFLRMKQENFSSVIDVNLASIARIDDMLLNEKSPMLRRDSKMIYLSSISGVAGGFGQTNYSCSKAGLMGYVAAQAQNLHTAGINVNAVAPGFIETEMTKAVPFATRNVGRIMNSLMQPGYPVDIAEALLFLSTDASSGINGSTIRVCGQHLVGA